MKSFDEYPKERINRWVKILADMHKDKPVPKRYRRERARLDKGRDGVERRGENAERKGFRYGSAHINPLALILQADLDALKKAKTAEEHKQLQEKMIKKLKKLDEHEKQKKIVEELTNKYLETKEMNK